jgi:large subunit ribosomal protein L13
MELLIMNTYSAKPKDIEKEWIVIDGTNLTVGRLATRITILLMGKHKPTYTPHMDCGDYVIVVNADKVKFTGRKGDRNIGKIYYRHTGYMGGIKQTTAGKILEGDFPTRVLHKAVQRMLAKGPMARLRLSHLYLYAGPEHPHQGQTPKLLDVASMNRKNIVG